MSPVVPPRIKTSTPPRHVPGVLASSRRALAWHIPAAALCVVLAGCAAFLPVPPAPPAAVDPISLFPMADYSQDVDHWIDPLGPDYDTPFLSARDQHAQFEVLYSRYFGTDANSASPWNHAFIDPPAHGKSDGDIAGLLLRRIANYDNTGKPGRDIGYGQNLRPQSKSWIDAIAQNMDVRQFERVAPYTPGRRAIATGNLLVRELPTMDPFFYSHRLAGQGYPFDSLQISAILPGTPLYVRGSSLDGGWCYVQAPEVHGWVRSDNLGFVDDMFVDTWKKTARQALGAVITASAPVRDSYGVFRFDAPAGTVLPLRPGTTPGMREVLVPARNIYGRAVISTAQLSDTQIVPAPWSATPRHLATLLKALIGRPYGWGNTGLYNDCSSELKNIFAAFGIWLQRHSFGQMAAGQITDLSSATPAERLDYLARNGQPMRTLVYINGHVMLYLGNTTHGAQTVPVVYHGVWGLSPADNSWRAIIGGTLIQPLFESIPEDLALQSLAAKPIFQISILGAPAADTPVQSDDGSPVDWASGGV